MIPRTPIILLAAAMLLPMAGGCSAFRRIFSGDSVGEGSRTVDGERRAKQRDAEKRKHRDPIDDMFEVKRMRDRAPRHQGLGLTAEEQAVFDAAEESADRDRSLIEAEKRRMSSDRKARKDWVFSFKPDKPQ